MSASLAVIRNRIAVGGRSGRWITDATGKVLLVSGVNMVNKRTPYTPAADGFGSADAAFLAANGLDAVRVGVLWEALQVAENNFWANASVDGEGLQDWYAGAWRHVAAYFNGNPDVLGYDLFNEPVPGTSILSCMLAAGGCPAGIGHNGRPLTQERAPARCRPRRNGDQTMGVNQRAQIRMSDEEAASFLQECRTATIATVGPGGFPHLVAMWYGLLDGKLYFETKARSQKAVNLRRDPKVSCSVEAGESYDQLRGVAIEGTAVIIDDTSSEEYWAAAVSVYERYQGSCTEEKRPLVEAMMNKRVVIRVDPARVRSWDHRKLGLPAMPVAGSTARQER